MKDLFDIPDNAPVDEEVIKDVKTRLSGLTKDIVQNKIEESKIIQESVANGGPSNSNEAIVNLMDYLNVGIRALAHAVNVPRKKLVNMIEGRTPMPPEVMSAIHDFFKMKQPSLFNDDIDYTVKKTRM